MQKKMAKIKQIISYINMMSWKIAPPQKKKITKSDTSTSFKSGYIPNNQSLPNSPHPHSNLTNTNNPPQSTKCIFHAQPNHYAFIMHLHLPNPFQSPFPPFSLISIYNAHLNTRPHSLPHQHRPIATNTICHS